MTYLLICCRLLLGVVFLVAVTGKLRGPAAFTAFVSSVRRMRVLPAALARPAATAVVAAEATIVAAAAVPVHAAGVLAFATAAALLTALTAGIVTSLARGGQEPCRCFGTADTPLGARHVARNAALAAVAGTGLLAGLLAAPTGAGPLAAPVDPALAAVAAAGGAVAGALIVMLDDIVALARPHR
ncbi:hypothetical protein Daura_20180 [Dactylosporangium aurantiacum]|uniref:Methylamine utilisation protein MauE domain-containing protein n=1 Tax=Dactylosporangium aurantiacum TaxID=35754 RepID=A0A9Q9MGG8_9ACTN|nr:MauE/DoxX family redox-associated membrane protein [Dactylosporangium aurantiacum]MDG6106215.1 hypothetical protein [Dactylosporangium aurantiacum]UWZ58283.1 hypothetical protein Daura_20180 [Dactylosporangium aurantiacum]